MPVFLNFFKYFNAVHNCDIAFSLFEFKWDSQIRPFLFTVTTSCWIQIISILNRIKVSALVSAIDGSNDKDIHCFKEANYCYAGLETLAQHIELSNDKKKSISCRPQRSNRSGNTWYSNRLRGRGWQWHWNWLNAILLYMSSFKVFKDIFYYSKIFICGFWKN